MNYSIDWDGPGEREMGEFIEAAWQKHRAAGEVWPHFTAPPKYENPTEGWEDPKLPDLVLIWAAARDCGYAIGLHGSMKRDVDLIAAPWTDEAKSADDLVSELCSTLNARVVAWEDKPHGRRAATLQIDGWFKPIDLSIMPRAIVLAAPSHEGAEG